MAYTRYHTWPLGDLVREVEFQLGHHDSIPADLAQEICHRILRGERIEHAKRNAPVV